jgi:uncharacterized iron-regulated membrane protein
MFRKVFFWSHLVSGVLAGLVILMMSVTGVLLTYERQILAWAEQSDFLSDIQGQERLTLDQLFFIAKTEYPDSFPTSIVITNDPGAPVTFSAGRSGGFSLNPLTGEAMETGSESLEHFFSTITGIHRWFNLSGEKRSTARAITGASNLIFLFLIFSGFYLWFPKIWTWGAFRIRFLFRNTAGKSKARDFNWHHVMGFWSAIPLIFVVATASVFYYPWANNLVYQVYGEEVPRRGAAPAPAITSAINSANQATGSLPAKQADYLSLQALYANAAHYLDSSGDKWRQISLGLPRGNSPTINLAIDQGNGGQPHRRHNMVLDRESGDIAAWQPFSSQSPGRQTRSIVRYLHTGEVLGLWGQTIAGLVSLTSIFMVWTGLALAWRRLVSPLFRKKKLSAA